MKKLILLLLVCTGIQMQAQIIDAVNDNYYVRVNICPSVLTVRFNDVVTLGSTQLIGVTNTLPFDNIIIDTNNITISYCWMGPYVKSRAFNYILYQDTSGTGIGVYDTATVSLSFANTDSIYPGDFNKDGIVNNIDLLGFAKNFRNTGLYRFGGSSINFLDYYGQDWDTVSNFNGATINAKYADFNGTGLVDSNDLLAYYRNYNKSYRTPTPITPTVGGPYLRIENSASMDTFFDGNTLQLNVVLGSNTDTIRDLLGIAYTISYDSTCIAPNTGDTAVRVQYSTTSNFFITPTNYLYSNIESIRHKEIQTAIASSNKTGTDGAGIVGNIVVVLDDYIDGNIKSPGLYPLIFRVKDVVAIKSNGDRIPVQAQSTIFYYKKTGTNIASERCANWTIYPNPASDMLMINSSCVTNATIKIMNMYGQLIDTFEMNTADTNYSLANYASGIYQVLIQEEGSIETKTLVIQH